jgi:hypothetical protein
MKRSQLVQVIAAAGAAVGLVTVRAPGGGGPAWSSVEPYLVHAAAGAAVGLAVAVAVLIVLRSRMPARAPRALREAIPERVRHEVWRRDRGICVECGSRGRLEFDHIIPVSRGGSNTVRNVELRCEPCNRRKGARI